MVTTVGEEASIGKLVTNLIYLEHDAIAAYDSCIDRLDNKELSAQIATFKQDHLQHLRVLTEMARELGVEVPLRRRYEADADDRQDRACTYVGVMPQSSRR
ncbi:rubrerythrin [Rhizobium sp. BK650]|uniref:ferritin-like domain-containing protein n=1 Tax=Rhizobium sp. BK650 TaxID=2586990 RepID=UPI0017B54CB2|nr:rubrerythrin [Rhizobium sp. BK650]